LFVSFIIVPSTNGAFIQNIDLPYLLILDSTANEGDDVAYFTVMLNGSNPGLVTVDYSTTDGSATAGSDYTATSGTLKFDPPYGGETRRISVPIIDDLLIEGKEKFYVNLSNPTNATIGDSQGIGTILSDDADPDRLESNGHYYEVIFVTNPPQGLQWHEAAYIAYMSSFHGIHVHLATIHIVQEQMLINKLRLEDLPQDKNTCWIGLHRLSHDSPWEWVTGEPSPTEGFCFWYGNQGEGGEYNLDEWYAMMCDWD